MDESAANRCINNKPIWKGLDIDMISVNVNIFSGVGFLFLITKSSFSKSPVKTDINRLIKDYGLGYHKCGDDTRLCATLSVSVRDLRSYSKLLLEFNRPNCLI